MSPEVNSNPPTITKRKKNKKLTSTPKINELSQQNALNSYPNLNVPDSSAFIPFMTYSVPTEPMSLPVYPGTYPNFSNPFMNYGGNVNPLNFAYHPNLMSVNGESNEYLSLPMVNLDQNDNDSKRRFSDPGLPNDSDSSVHSVDDRTIQRLAHQINILKDTNQKMSREMMELRMEINLLKQQVHLQHTNREYEPGMLADAVKEVRDAARVREDAMLARVKHMIEEKQLTLVSNMYREQLSISKSNTNKKNYHFL